MITLALETSTSRGGVALFEGGTLVFQENFVADRSHSSQLFAVIERALEGNRRAGQIVIGLGPGSYAGVRISISAAIGISVATGAELLGLPSVASLEEGEYLAIGDARRQSFYFTHVREGKVVEGPLLMDRETLAARLQESAWPVFATEPMDFPRVEVRLPEAARLGRLALTGQGLLARGALEPIYLREPHITQPRR